MKTKTVYPPPPKIKKNTYVKTLGVIVRFASEWAHSEEPV